MVEFHAWVAVQSEDKQEVDVPVCSTSAQLGEMKFTATFGLDPGPTLRINQCRKKW
ncbi:MAG: hypothetical protein WC913_04350 [Desulfuromonas sp.]